jgi:hypothetical protein
MDKYGSNPMKASFENCYIKSRIGIDPITGRPMSIWDEQISREKQILESVGELVIFFRQPIIPSMAVNGGKRCSLCWDTRRETSRSNCGLCNGFGVITDDPNVQRISGYEWLRNPDRDDSMFFTHQNMTPQRIESEDIGLMQKHEIKYWTVPIRNCEGKIVNILENRDVMIRYVFDESKQNKIQELGRYTLMDISYSLGPGNQILHMEFGVQQLNPGIDTKEYALPNFLT